jgi:hypothetical protein
MKKHVIITLLLMYVPFLLPAQQDTVPKIYKTWITLNDNSKEVKGILYEIKDSSIVVTNSLSRSDLLYGNFNITIIDYGNINIVKNRRNNRVLFGFLGGITLGFATGAIIGYSQGDDQCPINKWCIFQMTARDKASVGGILGALAGAGIGTIMGLVKIKIPISGNFEKFNKNKSRLKKYSYIH